MGEQRSRTRSVGLWKIGAALAVGYALGRLEAERSRLAELPEPEIVHQVPLLPIRLDGKDADPEQVTQFRGRPLITLVDRQTMSEGVLQVFTTAEQAQDYRSQVRAKEEARFSSEEIQSMRALRAATFFGGMVDLFEHTNYQGSRWTFYAYWGNIPDFTRVYPTLWWSTNINDRVSSVDTNIRSDPGTYPWTVLHEHVHFQGSELWLLNGLGLFPNIGIYGWNDRASSMSYRL